MNPQNPDHRDFYDAHVGARRQLHPSSRVAEKFSEPSIVLTIVFLIFAALYNFWGSPTLQGFVSWLETTIWDAVVTVTPSRLIQAVEGWQAKRANLQQMNTTNLNTHAAKSEAMRRILGLGMGRTGGVMASAFQSRTRALSMSSMLGFKADQERPPGLGNRDNSCFQNSILQGLASLQTFPEYLSACVRAAETDDASSEVAQTLQTLITDLTDGIHNGKTIWTPNKLRFMSTWTQQDAQEYYSKILDDIDKGIARATLNGQSHPGLEADSGKERSLLSQLGEIKSSDSASASARSQGITSTRNPLEGLLAQRVACVQCGFSEGLSMIPFNCLTLSLGLDRGQHDLYERLDAYSKVEPIEGVECSKCTLLKAQRLLTKLIERMRDGGSTVEQLHEPLRRLAAVEEAIEEDDFEDKTIAETCKIPNSSRVSTTKTKQVVIARPPRSLAVHMNRSVFDPSTFDMMKNSAPVSFPLTLDLGPWCLGSKTEGGMPVDTSAAGPTKVNGAESWALDPRASMIAGDNDTSRLSGPIYELRAAVTHSGRHENGHYICYRRHARNKAPASLSEDQAPTTEENTEDEDDVQSKDDHSQSKVPTRDDDSTEMVWWRLSDHNVSRVEEETVLSLSPGVFMLFYDCVDPSMVVNDDLEVIQDAPVVLEEEVPEDDILPIATPELTGDDDDGAQTESEGPGTPRNAPEPDKQGPSPRGEISKDPMRDPGRSMQDAAARTLQDA